jgi:hypothetical protein
MRGRTGSGAGLGGGCGTTAAGRAGGATGATTASAVRSAASSWKNVDLMRQASSAPRKNAVNISRNVCSSSMLIGQSPRYDTS